MVEPDCIARFIKSDLWYAKTCTLVALLVEMFGWLLDEIEYDKDDLMDFEELVESHEGFFKSDKQEERWKRAIISV